MKEELEGRMEAKVAEYLKTLDDALDFVAQEMKRGENPVGPVPLKFDNWGRCCIPWTWMSIFNKTKMKTAAHLIHKEITELVKDGRIFKTVGIDKNDNYIHRRITMDEFLDRSNSPISSYMGIDGNIIVGLKCFGSEVYEMKTKKIKLKPEYFVIDGYTIREKFVLSFALGTVPPYNYYLGIGLSDERHVREIYSYNVSLLNDDENLERHKYEMP
jgi:hypothetical protein